MFLTGEQITNILYYSEQLKASNHDIHDIALSMTKENCCLTVTFEDDLYPDVVMSAKMYIDKQVFPIQLINYNTFTEYINFVMKQEIIRRIDVLYNIK